MADSISNGSRPVSTGGPSDRLVSGTYQTILLPDGSFIFPNNQINAGGNSLTLSTQSYFGFTWDWNDGAGSLSDVNVNSGGVNFNVATPTLSSRWYFNPDGSTNLPSNVFIQQGDLSLGNTNLTGTSYATTSRLIFDSTANSLIVPNKISFYSNSTSGNVCGLSVSTMSSPDVPNMFYIAGTHTFLTRGTKTLNGYDVMDIQPGGQVNFGGSARAHIDIGNSFLPASNIQVRIDSSNIALAVSGSGRMGLGTLTPGATLEVQGNVYVTSNTVIGPAPTSILANLHVERGDIFIGNSALYGSSFSNTGSNRIVFDNSANLANGPNKISLFSNTTGNYGAGLGITGVTATTVSMAYWAYNGHQFYSGGLTSPYVVGGFTNGSTFTVGTTPSFNAKFYVTGGAPASNIMARIDSSNIALVTSGSGLVGFGTLTPSANLHVVGNAYVSNYLSTSTIVPTNPVSFRNRIINGDFLTDQRNSYANSTPSSTTNIIDRWKVNIFGSGRCQVGQNLGAIPSPSGFTSYYGMKVTTTTAVGAGDYFFFSQVIEGVNAVDWQWGSASARPVTLSFWVYSSLTGTMGGFVRNSGASGGNYSRSYPFTFSVSSANTWQYITVTIPGDTTGQWVSSQLDGPEFGIELWNGTNWQGSPGAWGAANYTGPTGGTANFAGTLNSYMYVSGFQVELGSIATPYERRPIGLELSLCQRYYETCIARMGGYHTAGNYLRSSVYFMTKKRPSGTPLFNVIQQLENNNMGSLNFDNSNFDQSSARILASVTATGDAYGQWKVSIDCEF